MKKFTLMLLMVFALGVTSVMAQGRTVSGTVVDAATKAPIAGATLMVQGTGNGAYAMAGGAFTIANVEGAVNLEVTMIGYKDVIFPVAASATNITIELTLSAAQMDEVVVIAYGSADKKSLTGSVAVLSTEDIESRPLTNIAGAIAGSSAGIATTSAEGKPGSAPSIRIRGIGSINSSSEPLYVVDGVPFAGDISAISSDDIASMSILKDAASTALYGSKASNGVVMIQTKTGRKDKVTFNIKINEGIMFRAMPEYDKVNSDQFYELAWETQRNDLYYDGGQSLADATALASSTMVSKNSMYNIMQDKTTGKQMADGSIITPYQPANAPAGYMRAGINPDSQVFAGYADDMDWMDAVSGIGFRQNYNISASGGSDKATYFTSIGYTDEDSYFAETSYTRINARAKVDITPTKWLKMGTNVMLSHSVQENPYGDGATSTNNPWQFARNMAPIYPVNNHNQFTGEYMLDSDNNKILDNGNVVYDEDGVTINKRARGQDPNRNVIREGQLNKKTWNITNVNAQAYAAITFLKDFKFTINGSLDINNQTDDEFGNTEIGDAAPTGRMYTTSYRTTNYNFSQNLEWGRSFDKHNIDILVGHENFSKNENMNQASKTGLMMPGIYQLNNFSEMNGILGYLDTYRSEGYLGRANYNFDEKYYFSASFRRDGSSKFAPENRWGNFWSVGASWIISSEDFMSNAMWVDFLKLRASYGTNGNDGGFDNRYVSYYAFQPLYGLSSNSGSAALYWDRSNPGFPDLKWETAGALDVAAEFRFWNRLNGSLGYYEKSSDELIMDVPVALSSGTTVISQNIGSMVNRGVELALDVDAIRKGDWLWNIGMNIAWQQNRITSLPESVRETGIRPGGGKIIKEGYSIYEFYMIQLGGIDAADGANYFEFDAAVDKNGKAKFEWNPAESNGNQFEKDGVKYTKNVGDALYDYSGDGLSPISGALTSSLTWKNLTLDLLFTYRLGGKSYDASYANLSIGGDFFKARSTDLYNNAWRQPGDVASLPRLSTTNSNLNTSTDASLISNSYIALQNVTLSYAFPKKVANKLSLDGLSVYVSGENLFQISSLKGYDAMSSFGGYSSNAYFGSVATVSLGINVSF